MMSTMSRTSFFENMLGAKFRMPRSSWGAMNPLTGQYFLCVWDDQIRNISGVDCALLLSPKWSQTSNGIRERKRHVEALRDGAEGYGVLCISSTTAIHDRKIKSFDKETLLKFGMIVDRDDDVYVQISDRISINDLDCGNTGQASVIPDLKRILRNSDVTEREALANARMGQGRFRAEVLAIWNGRCCVTDITTQHAIRASHIKPWRDADNQERLDPENGLPLVATLDALFDAGLITFSSDGRLHTSPRLDNAERQRLAIEGQSLRRRPSARTADYLAYHREWVFRNGS